MAETINIEGDLSHMETMNGNNDNKFDIWEHFVPPALGNATNAAKNEMHPASDVEVSAVISSLGFNAIIFFAVIGLYELCFRVFPSVYRTNSMNYYNNNKGGSTSPSSAGSTTSSMIDIFAILPKSNLPLAWVPTILRVSWSQVRQLCGLDAYFFLRYIRLCFQVTAVSGVWALAILWPVYASGGNSAHGWYHLSMANVTPGSWKLWFPTGFMCFLTFYLLFLLNEEYKHYVDCRMEFLAKGNTHVHSQQRYTLLVEEIPNELRSDKALHDYFEQLFPGRVYSSCIVLHVPDLQELYERREKVVRRLEKINAIQQITGKRPFHKVGGTYKLLGRSALATSSRLTRRRRVDFYEQDSRLPQQQGERVDSIQYFTKYLQILNEKLAELQQDKMDLAKRGDNAKLASEWIAHSLGLMGSSVPNISTGEGDGMMVSSSGHAMNLTSGVFFLIRKLGLDFFFGGLTQQLNRPLDVVVDTMVGRTLTSTGFVSFTDLVTVTCAIRAPLSHEAGALRVRMAPDTRDVVWTNADINASWSAGREWSADVMLGLGAVLWSIPVTAVQALANLNSLSHIAGLNWIHSLAVERPALAAFLNGYLPVVALLLLIATLPYLFHMVALKYERLKTHSSIQHSILKRFFYYQLANIYITVTAGSILDSIADILDHPSNAFAILGNSVPTVVGYFVMFILTKIFAGLPIILLQVGPLMKSILATILCRDRIMTQRELDDAYKPVPLDLGIEYPNQLLVIVIMFTYGSISPIILPVGTLYFLAAFIVYKKQLLFVFSSTYESGGIFFPTACNRTMVGMVMAQCTLIGYTVLRSGFYQPMVLLPLPFYTVAMMGTFKHLYEDPGHYLSLERAIDLDKRESTKSFDPNVYRQPILVHKDVEPLPFRRSELTAESTMPSEKVV